VGPWRVLAAAVNGFPAGPGALVGQPFSADDAAVDLLPDGSLWGYAYDQATVTAAQPGDWGAVNGMAMIRQQGLAAVFFAYQLAGNNVLLTAQNVPSPGDTTTATLGRLASGPTLRGALVGTWTSVSAAVDDQVAPIPQAMELTAPAITVDLELRNDDNFAELQMDGLNIIVATDGAWALAGNDLSILDTGRSWDCRCWIIGNQLTTAGERGGGHSKVVWVNN